MMTGLPNLSLALERHGTSTFSIKGGYKFTKGGCRFPAYVPREAQVIINRVITGISVFTSTEVLGIVLAEMYVHKSLSCELYNGSKSIK